MPASVREIGCKRLDYPTPRLLMGHSLRGIASAAIDISDGLAADLGHILRASGVAAEVELDKLPLGDALCETLPEEAAFSYALSGGDDYELCFTVPQEHQGALETLVATTGVPVSCIGHIQPGEGTIRYRYQNKAYRYTKSGYQHFQQAV